MSASPRGSHADLLIRHGHVISMDDEHNIYPDGAIAITGSRIVAVGKDADIAGEYTADRVIDAGGAPVHPGLIECHLHASFHIYRGALADQILENDVFDSFETAFYNSVNDEEEHLSVLLACLEMIRNGTTCFLEAGTILSTDAAARAAQRVGIRAILADAFIWDEPQGFAQGMREEEANGCETCAAQARIRTELTRAPKSRAEALERMGRELERNTDPDVLVRGHVAILGLGTASEELMNLAKDCADANGVVLNLHQSYSPADTEADRVRFGKDPLVHLRETGFLSENVVLGHANHLNDAECDVLLESGASIAWAPSASMMWGHGGTFQGRHAELYRRGANIALGSDSSNWSNDFDMLRQASTAVLTAREAHMDRTFLIAEDGLFMATRGGAQASGMKDSLGSIETGKLADVVVHTLDRPELVPSTDMVRNLIYSSRSKSVDTVIVGGKIVLEKQQFPGLDEKALLAEVRNASVGLLARMGYEVQPNSLTRRGA